MISWCQAVRKCELTQERQVEAEWQDLIDKSHVLTESGGLSVNTLRSLDGELTDSASCRCPSW